MGSIAEALNKRPAGPSSLKDMIKTAWTVTRASSPVASDGWLRTSSIARVCPREEGLAVKYLGIRARSEAIKAALMMIFEHGTGLHVRLQNVILPQALPFFGVWRCSRCGTAHGGLSGQQGGDSVAPPDRSTERLVSLCKGHRFGETTAEEAETFAELMRAQLNSLVRRPEQCSGCGVKVKTSRSMDAPFLDFDADTSEVFRYEERWYGDIHLHLGGHPDGFIEVPWRRGRGVFEAKSIGTQRAWRNQVRDAPLQEHVEQVNAYMAFTGLSWAMILYWDKGAFGLPFLEHEVEFDAQLWARQQQRVLDVWWAVGGGASADRVCVNPYCKRAKDCSYVRECFSG